MQVELSRLVESTDRNPRYVQLVVTNEAAPTQLITIMLKPEFKVEVDDYKEAMLGAGIELKDGEIRLP